MRIRFLSDQIYDTGGPGKGPLFPAGHVMDAAGVVAALGLKEPPSAEFATAFLDRWVKRNVAEAVDGRTPLSADPIEMAGGPRKPASPAPLGTASRGSATPGLDDGKQVEKLDLHAMTRVDLDALAKKRSVDVSDAKNKGDIIAALELAAEAGE